MTERQREIVGWMALILLPMAYVIGSEMYYAHSISPRGISTVRDYFDRFGEPHRICVVQRDGRDYYEFSGHLPSGFVWAFPSAPPAYVFDEQGRFTAWCSDPGDIPSHRQTWQLQSTNHIEMGVIRKQFGL